MDLKVKDIPAIILSLTVVFIVGYCYVLTENYVFGEMLPDNCLRSCIPPADSFGKCQNCPAYSMTLFQSFLRYSSSNIFRLGNVENFLLALKITNSIITKISKEFLPETAVFILQIIYTGFMIKVACVVSKDFMEGVNVVELQRLKAATEGEEEDKPNEENNQD